MTFSGFSSGLNEQSRAATFELGLAAWLMGEHPRYSTFPVACLSTWLHPPIMLKQIKFYFDGRGSPVGYVTWSFLAPDVEQRWIRDPDVMLHISEWNEEGALWVMDIVALHGYFKFIAADLARREFRAHRQVKFVRRRPDGAPRKLSIWPIQKLAKRLEKY